MRDIDPRRIRLVAAHYDDLQGLRTIAWMLWNLAMFGLSTLLPQSGWPRPLFFAAVALYIPLVREPLRRYYGRRLGRVGGASFFTPEVRWSCWLLMAVCVFHGTPANPVFVLLCVGYPLYFAWSGWPYRAQYLGTAVVALALLWGRLAGTTVDVVTDAEMEWRTLVLMLTLAIASLADHAQLVRMLGGARASGPLEQSHAAAGDRA